MNREIGRIRFIGNPWPAGHAITTFEMTGRLDADRGLLLDVELRSANYYAEVSEETLEAQGAAEEQRGWHGPSVWGNYHSCRMGTNDDSAIVLGSRERRLDTRRPLRWEIAFDPAGSTTPDTEIVSIYLLGHDSVGDHRISFVPSTEPGCLRVEWRGRIARTYVGDDDFRYRFEATLPAVPFAGFSIPDALSDDQARWRLTAFVTDPDAFQLSAGPRRFVPRIEPAAVAADGPRLLI